MEITPKTIPLIAQQIDVKPEDFEYSVDQFALIAGIDRSGLEVVQICTVHQTDPDPLDWWGVVIFAPNPDSEGSYYHHLEIDYWGSGPYPELAQEDQNIVCLYSLESAIDLRAEYRYLDLAMIFESDTHQYIEAPSIEWF